MRIKEILNWLIKIGVLDSWEAHFDNDKKFTIILK